MGMDWRLKGVLINKLSATVKNDSSIKKKVLKFNMHVKNEIWTK